MVCHHVLILCMHPIINIDDYAIMWTLVCIQFYKKNLKVTSNRSGMYYILYVVCMHPIICTDIMCTSYYGAYIYGCAIMWTLVCMQFTRES